MSMEVTSEEVIFRHRPSTSAIREEVNKLLVDILSKILLTSESFKVTFELGPRTRIHSTVCDDRDCAETKRFIAAPLFLEGAKKTPL